MGWRILVDFIRQPMLKLKAHSGLHDLFLRHMTICENYSKSKIHCQTRPIYE